MDYKKVLRLHFVNHLSCCECEIAESCGDCSKTTVNKFLKRFRENLELSYPLPADVTNEYIGNMLYKKPGVSADQLLYRDFKKEAFSVPLYHKKRTCQLHHLQFSRNCKTQQSEHLRISADCTALYAGLQK